jgi:NAD(P)-dependent dehydrogenase (short-subunit alcohol dehydrogenase family)
MSISKFTDYQIIKSLFNKTIVITGAVGILGSELVAAFFTNGCKIILIDFNNDVLFERVHELNSRRKGCARGFNVDISNQLSIKKMVDELATDNISVDVLINNAASKGAYLKNFFEPTTSFTMETWREVMQVNIDGTFFITQAMVPFMKDVDGASIVNVSSIYGLLGSDERIYEGAEYMGIKINTPAVYATSKAGIIGLTRYLATQWGFQGIRVNCVCPGGIESGQNQIFKRNYSSRVPMGRMAKVNEIVNPIVFLSSNCASYINGQVIAIDGGLSAW